MKNYVMLNKLQKEILAIGVAGIIGLYLLSEFIKNTYFALDEIDQVYFFEIFAATIGIVFFILRKISKKIQYEDMELLMLIVIIISASINLLPSDVFNPTLLIILSIIAAAGWFAYFGLGKFLGDKKQIDKTEFRMRLVFFIGITAFIIVVFNIIRVSDLFKPPT